MSQAIEQGRTNWSRDIPGSIQNHGWSVKVDVHATGYVGITQDQGHPNGTQRILLSPAQWREIVRFVREEKPR